MSKTVHCPDCGFDNAEGSASCAHCNFPLVAQEAAHAASVAAASGPAASGAAASANAASAPGDAAPPKTQAAPAAHAEPDTEFVVPRMRPPRGRRVRRAGPEPQALSIWLMAAVVAVVVAIVVAIRGYKQTNPTSHVDGANQEQLKAADQFRAQLAQDSTDIQANIGLANVLFDTGNWSEAIIRYRAAIARDSTRATTFVDLGVCYYNLGDAGTAEQMFRLGLQRDPQQPVALFNMGVVAESKGDNQTALKYFHQALDNHPPEGMNQSIMDAMKRVQTAIGKTGGKLPEGAAKSGF
jgi:tetratricopeptide (TPR) repeat protein